MARRRLGASQIADLLANSDTESSHNSESSDVTDESADEEELPAEPSSSDTGWRFVTPETDKRDGLPIFNACPGPNPNLHLPEATKENLGEFLDAFLTQELFEQLVSWTNIRAGIAFDDAMNDLSPDETLSGSIADWTNCSVNDLKKMIAIFMIMALNNKPEMRSYWSKNPIYSSDIFHADECLPRNRFLLILRYLRFADYAQLSNDRLNKIRPFLDLVSSICRNAYLPSRNIAVDESLLLYKGRIFMKRYIPSKRSRYGLLTYCLCETSTGYTWNFMLASSAAENQSVMEGLEGVAGQSFSEKVVVYLLSSLVNKGYHLFTDNFFTSERLAKYLIARRTLLTGTLRPNRGAPAQLKNHHVPVKSHAFCRNNELMVVKMVDKKSSGLKTVYIMDTSSVAANVDITRTQRGGVQETLTKPRIVTTYSKGMKGVDQRDASLHPYNIVRKSYKWFTKIGVHLIHLLIKNAFVVFQHRGSTMDFLEFQEEIIKLYLLSTGPGRSRGSSRRDGQPMQRRISSTTGNHLPQRLTPRPNRPRPTKRCRQCWRIRVRKESVFFCPACEGEPGLCVGACFATWHSELNL